MIFNRFTKDARRVVEQARVEAHETGATTIEAQHLLLALTRQNDPATTDTLASAGLDHGGVLAALAAERDAALAVVGVSVADYHLPAPTSRGSAPDLRFATSAKAALEQALQAASERDDRRIEAAHVLLGLLAAERGTVPRALEAAGVGRRELREAVGRRLSTAR